MARKGVNRMDGIASIALLPGGFVSGHFIQLPHSVSYGIHGSELFCERECSRGEDYRLIKLSIIDFASKKEQVAVVECRGHDAARFQSIQQAHGWEEDVIGMLNQEQGEQKISISFECETLKADASAQEHLQKYMPNLIGLDAVVNIGRMSISGVDFSSENASLVNEIAA